LKNVQKIDLGLTGYDELFANDEERKVNKLPRIFDIPISEIDDFPDHPFKVKIDEDMDQLVQSIKERGIITPVTLRPKEDGRYEIVSGHRRKKACELAGLDTVKAEVREMNRDEAIILMVESNLQRSTILPSEKAFSYKMRLEAMNRQGQRTDLTSVPVAQKSTSREQLGKEVGESQDQVRRYIRLTQLIQPLLDLVDEGRIAFRPAVELSYLKKEEQEDLLEEISYADATPSLAQAIKMKRFSQEGKLSNEVIESIMSEEKPNQKEKIRIKYEDARRFIPDSVPYNKTGEYIMKALEYYHRVQERQKDRGEARYVTENTFDSYLYQLVEGKQKFIGQIMTSKSPVRSAEDIDETALSYAEIKALCAGNPHIKEKMDLDIDVSRLKLLKANHLSQRYALEDQIIKEFPQKIKSLEQRIDGYKADMAQLAQNTLPNEDGFSSMIIAGGTVTDKKAAGEAIIGLCKSRTNPDPIHIGEYRGFDMELFFDSFSREYKITLKHELRHTVTLGTDIFGNIQRLDNALNSFQEKLTACEAQLENTKVQLENAKLEVQKPFPQEDELKTKTARLNELNAMLNLDKRENEIVDGERAEEEPSRSSDDRER